MNCRTFSQNPRIRGKSHQQNQITNSPFIVPLMTARNLFCPGIKFAIYLALNIKNCPYSLVLYSKAPYNSSYSVLASTGIRLIQQSKAPIIIYFEFLTLLVHAHS